MNALFFTDKTMHKIYLEKGIFTIITQLPKIFYSTLITGFIDMILRYLALSENDIIYLKNIKKIK